MLHLALAIVSSSLIAAAAPVHVDIKRVDAVEPTITFLLDIRDSRGEIVGGWSAGDVSVTIDGDVAPVGRVSRFVDSGEQFGTMLLFDTSCSMKASMPKVHQAANTYIDGMKGGDVASFAWFNDASYGEKNPWSGDKNELRRLVSQFHAVGNQTRFYEALNKVIAAIDENPKSPRYRAVLVLSDGIDEGSPDPFTFDRAVRISLEKDVPVNAVGFLPGRDPSGLPVLQALAHDTQGYYALAENEGEIATRFQQFQNSLHSLLLVEVQVNSLAVGDRDISVALQGAPGEGAARTRLELDAPWGGTASEEDSEDLLGVFDTKTGMLIAVGGGLLLLLVLVGGGVGVVASFQRSASAPPVAPTPLPAPMPTPPSIPLEQTPPRMTAVEPPPKKVTRQMPAPAPAPDPSPAPARTVFRPAGSNPMARFVLSGGQSIYLFQSGPQSVFGSDPGRCDAVLDESTISGVHASLSWSPDGQFWIEDRGSTNGTYLGGVDIRNRGPVSIQDGQTIQLGTVRVLFQRIG